MHQSWFDRVESYLDEVEEIAGKIDETLKSTRLETSEFNAVEVERQNVSLMESLALLEMKIAEREQLLQAEDAPQIGVTLTEKIVRSASTQSQGLAERCRAVSAMVSTVNQRAISLFVCQFHLSQLGSDIVRLLAGQTSPPTYQAPNRSEKSSDLGGGLFNEAA